MLPQAKALIGWDRPRKIIFSGDVQSIDAARAWNNEYSLEGIVSYIDNVTLYLCINMIILNLQLVDS